MQINLAKGVKLHVMPTEKFKTVTITIKFKEILDAGHMTKRTLISNLINTNSQHYPTQTDFRNALSELYGARLSTSVSKKGKYHIISVSMSIVNEKYLREKDILEKAIALLENILYYPNAYHEAFHSETFKREINNLRDEYEAIYDDKQDYSAIALNELYFDTEEQKIPSFGREEDLNAITPENLYKAYKRMLYKNEIDIFVLGDVMEENIFNTFKRFKFADREINTQNPFYKLKKANGIKRKTEKQDLTQARYNLAFNTNIFYHQNNYYVGQVFNGLFGGYPHSKLFMNVREKESLAYTISSGIDTFTGSMFVYSGIDQKEASHVKKIVLRELDALIQGDFNEDAMKQTKELLKNSLYHSADNANSMIESAYASMIIREPQMRIEEWVERIEGVTKAEVMNAAKEVQLKAEFLLIGKEE
ncbi:EF-P 5-aminopentanol modification-associated protein YfmF [Marinilactibacillus psychrotolerans]|uniref:EF-P 5-aminopentanol modification-associated protein YfmF n=1 Tax=Marinilactibacillus psychrotolerans TaxID=191770 RepID=UPI003888B638